MTTKISGDTGVDKVQVTSPIAFGYGAGSGGTVTQATSKITDVVLHTPTGKIIMTSATMAPGATVSFNLLNFLVGPNDIVIVSLQGGLAYNPANYIVKSVATSISAAYISLQNSSAVALSEALVINFAVIKGATA